MKTLKSNLRNCYDRRISLMFLLIFFINMLAFGQDKQSPTNIEAIVIRIAIGLAVLLIVYGVIVINKSVRIIKGYGEELDWTSSISRCLYKNRNLVSFVLFVLVIIGIYYALTYSH